MSIGAEAGPVAAVADRLSVLFVDDEQPILDGLRRQLRGHRAAWDMRFSPGGADALRQLAERPADVVVSDLRMPGMGGGALLDAVLRLCPEAIRIMLSGQADPVELVGSLGPIHQYLQKPCDPASLCEAIDRTWGLARLLRDPRLRRAAARVTALPPCSDTHAALVRELVRADAGIDAVAKIIGRDPALIAKVMQLVNSAFFAAPRRVGTVRDAVVRLGLKTIHSVVVAGRLFDFLAGPSCGGPRADPMADLWTTSVAVGELAGELAARADADEAVRHQARLAGAMSLVGRAVLMTAEPEAYAAPGGRALAERAVAEGRPLGVVEADHFGASQDAVGAYALGLWGFADELVEAVAFQSAPSRPARSGRGHPATYLHLARVLLGGGTDPLAAGPPADVAYIEGLGLGRLLDPTGRRAA